MKYRDGIGKWVLKQALRPLLPDDVLFRTKMGFSLPYEVWMRRSLALMIRDLLSPERVARRGLFDPEIRPRGWSIGSSPATTTPGASSGPCSSSRDGPARSSTPAGRCGMPARRERILIFRSGRHLRAAVEALRVRAPAAEITVVTTSASSPDLEQAGIDSRASPRLRPHAVLQAVAVHHQRRGSQRPDRPIRSRLRVVDRSRKAGGRAMSIERRCSCRRAASPRSRWTAH